MPSEKEDPKNTQQRIDSCESGETSSKEGLTRLCQHLQGMTTSTTAWAHGGKIYACLFACGCDQPSGYLTSLMALSPLQPNSPVTHPETTWEMPLDIYARLLNHWPMNYPVSDPNDTLTS